MTLPIVVYNEGVHCQLQSDAGEDLPPVTFEMRQMDERPEGNPNGPGWYYRYLFDDEEPYEPIEDEWLGDFIYPGHCYCAAIHGSDQEGGNIVDHYDPLVG